MADPDWRFFDRSGQTEARNTTIYGRMGETQLRALQTDIKRIIDAAYNWRNTTTPGGTSVSGQLNLPAGFVDGAGGINTTEALGAVLRRIYDTRPDLRREMDYMIERINDGTFNLDSSYTLLPSGQRITPLELIKKAAEHGISGIESAFNVQAATLAGNIAALRQRLANHGVGAASINDTIVNAYHADRFSDSVRKSIEDIVKLAKDPEGVSLQTQQRLRALLGYDQTGAHSDSPPADSLVARLQAAGYSIEKAREFVDKFKAKLEEVGAAQAHDTNLATRLANGETIETDQGPRLARALTELERSGETFAATARRAIADRYGVENIITRPTMDRVLSEEADPARVTGIDGITQRTPIVRREEARGAVPE